MANKQATLNQAFRLRLIDSLRGALLLLMVAYHLCYDLVFLVGKDLAFFTPDVMYVWRSSVSCSFLFIAGMMCHESRSNLKRALKYSLVAILIWLITTIVAVDTPINFGIIYCMAASTFIYIFLKKLNLAPSGLAAAIILFCTYLFLQGLAFGRIWAFGVHISMPELLYSSEYLNWLGFMGPHFSSSDYYPILPNSLVFLSGAACMAYLKQHDKAMSVLTSHGLTLLEYIGKLSLPIYVIHQPLILLVLYLMGLL